MFMGSEGHKQEGARGHEEPISFVILILDATSWVQAEKREARANQVKLDAQQLESLLFQLFERKVRQL